MTATHLSPRAAERRLYLLTSTRWLPVGFVVGIFILVLMLLLRSMVAPLYLVATVLLSYGSAIGHRPLPAAVCVADSQPRLHLVHHHRRHQHRCAGHARGCGCRAPSFEAANQVT